MNLSKDEIKHIARLARLELSEDEIKKYKSQLSSILDYVGKLKEAKAFEKEPTAQVSGLENVFRDDVLQNFDICKKKDALNQAPEIEGGQIKVKKIL